MANGEEMVKVDLRRSVGARASGSAGAQKLYGPGKGVEVPKSLARSLGLKASRARARAGAGVEREAGDKGEAPTDPYKGFKKEDYVAEAERRELQVARSDGDTEKDPTVDDYRAALQADDTAKASE